MSYRGEVKRVRIYPGNAWSRHGERLSYLSNQRGGFFASAKGGAIIFLMLVKCHCATRLETRTKESNMYASIRVQKPIGVAKANLM